MDTQKGHLTPVQSVDFESLVLVVGGVPTRNAESRDILANSAIFASETKLWLLFCVQNCTLVTVLRPRLNYGGRFVPKT